MQMPNQTIDISFKVFFHAIPAACLLCDTKGNILMSNASAESLLQLNAASLEQKNILELIPDLQLPKIDNNTSTSAHHTHATIIFHGNPQYISLQWAFIHDKTNHYLVMTISNDRRRQAEHALQNILHSTLPAAEEFNDQLKLAALTEREREVMSLAVAGYHNKEIARALGISHRTVEIHKSRIMHKTGASNLLDLARIATAAQVTVRS